MNLRAAAVAALLVLTSCVGRKEPPPIAQPEPQEAPQQALQPPPVPPPPANALESGVSLAQTDAALDPLSAARAYHAFKLSCPTLLGRTDRSGLSKPEDWQRACAATVADDLTGAGAASYFRDHFEFVRIGDGKAFATGYYEPEIAGSRTRVAGYEVPVYRVPADLVQGVFPDGKSGRGRYDETGIFTLYQDRAAIDDGALADKGLEIAWAADAIDLFFLQIQGSGRLRLPDGGVMRIGYAGQNGREYIGIGKLMKDRGLIGPGQTSMQGIIARLRAYPEDGRAIMRENKSYVFFQELTGPGPLGSLGLPVSPRATVAVDPRFVPYGAPVLLTLDTPEASGLWIAQDTGGAIKGANRFDTFWGAGDDAKRIAGGMQGRGDALVLLPQGTVARLRAAARDDARAQR